MGSDGQAVQACKLRKDIHGVFGRHVVHQLLRPASKGIGVVAVGGADNQAGQVLEGWKAWLLKDEVGSSGASTGGTSRGLRDKTVATTAPAKWVGDHGVHELSSA
jgi:hypothetical protein